MQKWLMSMSGEEYGKKYDHKYFAKPENKEVLQHDWGYVRRYSLSVQKCKVQHIKVTMAEFCANWASKGIIMTIIILKQKYQEVQKLGRNAFLMKKKKRDLKSVFYMS